MARQSRSPQTRRPVSWPTVALTLTLADGGHFSLTIPFKGDDAEGEARRAVTAMGNGGHARALLQRALPLIKALQQEPGVRLWLREAGGALAEAEACVDGLLLDAEKVLGVEEFATLDILPRADSVEVPHV